MNDQITLVFEAASSPPKEGEYAPMPCIASPTGGWLTCEFPAVGLIDLAKNR